MPFETALAATRLVALINLVMFLALLAAAYMRGPQVTIRQSLVILLSTTVILGLSTLAVVKQDGTALTAMMFAQLLALFRFGFWLSMRRFDNRRFRITEVGIKYLREREPDRLEDGK